MTEAGAPPDAVARPCFSLGGRRGLITGASRGLGRVIAEALAAQGVRLALCARSIETLESTARSIENGGAERPRTIAVDVTDGAGVTAAVARAARDLDGLDILVNCAAGPLVTSETPTADAMLRDLDVKLGGYLRFMQAATAFLARSQAGRIVNVGGFTIWDAQSPSGLRNAAVAHLTAQMAARLGQFGVTVNLIHPGMLRASPYLEQIERRAAAEGRLQLEIEAEEAADTALGRLPSPADVAALTAFLCSPYASSITGQSIAVDAGRRSQVRY